MIIQFAPTKPSFLASTKTQIEPTPATSEIIPFQDMRKVGLQSVGKRLSASRGDLGEVFEARAKADIFYCPVCPEPHQVA